MKKNYLFIILFINILTVLIGCQDQKSLDQILFIDSMGIDYDDKNKTFDLYYHIASGSTLITTELGAGSSDSIYSIGHTECSSIYEGIRILTGNSIKNIALTHIQSIILTYDFIKYENLNILVELLKTYNFISPNFYIFATKSKLEDIFTIQNPENISPFFTIITSNDFVSAYDLVYFTELGRSITEDYLTAKIIVIESSQEYWQNNDKEITTISPIGNIYINKNDEKLFIDNEVYQSINLVNFEYSTTIIFDQINFTIYRQKIRIKEKDDTFYIKLKGEIYPTRVNSKNQKEIRLLFENKIKEDFYSLINYTKEHNIDFLNLQDILYRKGKLKSDFEYKATNIIIETDYKLLN